MKILSYILAFIMVIAIASAVVNVNEQVNYAEVASNGAVTKTTTPVNNANFVAYTCNNPSCTSVGGQIYNVNTGSDNKVTVQYPTALQGNGYLIWVYKDGYIPWYYHADWYGTGTAPGIYTEYLGKKKACHAPINEFSVINDAKPNIPLVIDVSASLDATTHSALRCNYDVYLPSHLRDDLTTRTRVKLEIYNHNNKLVHTETKYLDLFCSTAGRVQFTWTPTIKGDYQAYVRTIVEDPKCLSSTEDQASKYFHVLSDEPRNICYTLLNDLTMDDPFPTVGDNIEFSGTKISNYADSNYNLYPVATQMTYKIYHRASGNLVFQDSEQFPANANEVTPSLFDFNWDTASAAGGYYDLYATGIASDSRCNGLENLDETVDLGFLLDKPVNNAPRISGIPDKNTFVGDSAKNRWIDLYQYASDPDQADSELTFRIISQSNTDAITCSIDAKRYVSCQSPKNAGLTHIIVEVWDGQATDRDDFYITVTECKSGDKETKQCGQSNTGECSFGHQDRTCKADGTWSDWSQCYGAVYPAEEVCDGKDNDCDGKTDEDGVCWTCTPGDSEYKSCGTNVGACEFGQQKRTCNSYGDWGDWGNCQGGIGPATEVCDGKDNDCDGKTDEDGVCWTCTPGDSEYKSCGTNVGACEFGQQKRTCNSYGDWGVWGNCQGGIGPVTEVCDGKDNDCDGKTDEDGVCGSCSPGEKERKSCGTSDVGKCSLGYQERVCSDNGLGGGVWGDYSKCIGAVYPATEVCDGKDNDCDGKTDEDGVCGSCSPGEKERKSCGTSDVGQCSLGYQERVCSDNGLGGGVWGDYSKCIGAVYPATEVCDGKDNDCDGKTDEDGVCGICTPGDHEERSCGTEVGTCSAGSQVRVCKENTVGGGYWSGWSACVGGTGPSEEQCDGLDNDCDGKTDEQLPPIYIGIDTGVCEKDKQMCIDGYYQVTDPGVSPSTEICDGLDNDCDGKIDEGGVCGECTPGTKDTKKCGQSNTGACSYGHQERSCQDNGIGGGIWGDWSSCMGAVYPTKEICDGYDNDCDGYVDEEVCGPSIDGIPDQNLQEDSGITDYLVYLPAYASDPDDNTESLSYTISAQTRTDIVSCYVNNELYLACQVQDGKTGQSMVTAQVADGTATDTDSFYVNVADVNDRPELHLPDLVLPYNSGFVDNALDLWKYAQDEDTPDSQLQFTILSQSRKDIVDCQIDSNRYLDCTVTDYMHGDSSVEIQVYDGEYAVPDTMKVTVKAPEGDIEVQVLYPNGGELLRGTIDILWYAVSTHSCPSAESIKIEYSKDYGLHWSTLADNEANDGTYSWDTTGFVSQATYLIKITATDCVDSAFDVSDGTFAISNREISPDEPDLGDYRLDALHVILVDEVIDPEKEDVRVIITMQNMGDFDMENIKVTAVIQDLAVRDSIGPLDLDENDVYSGELYLDIPRYAPPGLYDIRFTFSNPNVKKVKYRYFTIN